MINPQHLDILEEMVLELKFHQSTKLLQIGKGRIIKEGKKVAILNFGTRLEECKKASEI